MLRTTLRKEMASRPCRGRWCSHCSPTLFQLWPGRQAGISLSLGSRVCNPSLPLPWVAMHSKRGKLSEQGSVQSKLVVCPRRAMCVSHTSPLERSGPPDPVSPSPSPLRGHSSDSASWATQAPTASRHSCSHHAAPFPLLASEIISLIYSVCLWPVCPRKTSGSVRCDPCLCPHRCVRGTSSLSLPRSLLNK